MIPFSEFKEIFTRDDGSFIEQLAQKARETSIRYFGRTVSIYAPLYLSNYCENYCLYCGFHSQKNISRKQLTCDEIREEMYHLSSCGIQSVLLLTGESRTKTPVSYIKEAVDIARNYFANISIEVYPMETVEYEELFSAGVDGVTIYQETYNTERYHALHVKGKKSDYEYRVQTPERIAKAGIRMINMGVLLGLTEPIEDLYHLFLHIEQMERQYPGVEYGISFPRVIPINDSIQYWPIPDVFLIKSICIARLMFPRVGITLSTREKAFIRDHAINLGVTKISAASRTSVGGYSITPDNPDEDGQFEVMDKRSIDDIVQMLKLKGFDPVFTDWRRIGSI